jgi:hypothetical protein
LKRPRIPRVRPQFFRAPAVLLIAIIACAQTLAPSTAFAEIETRVELTLLGSFLRNAAGDPGLAFIAAGELGFAAINNPDVKAELTLAGAWTDAMVTPPEDLLKKAYIRTHFDVLRVTAGKTRVAWGDGFLFNAGDVVFGSMLPVADLSVNLLRDTTDWMVDLYLPLGDFSFLESIILPFSPLRAPGSPLVAADTLRGGGRIVTKLAGVKMETGYLFRADAASHRPYVSFQGNLFFDAYVSASMDIPSTNPTERNLRDGLAVTAGIYRLFSFDDGSSLLVRVEAASWPFGIWNEADAAGFGSADRFGIIVYPEITWSPTDILAIQLRAMMSPVDGSGLVSLMATWSIYQGFDLLGYAWVMYGDANDTYFGFDRPVTGGGMGISAGFRYIY